MLLRRGSRGFEVEMLQNFLNVIAGPGSIELATDGAFGTKTDTRVREFQRKNMLKVDGIVGPQTMGQMEQMTGSVMPRFGGGSGGGTSKPAVPKPNSPASGFRLLPHATAAEIAAAEKLYLAAKASQNAQDYKIIETMLAQYYNDYKTLLALISTAEKAVDFVKAVGIMRKAGCSLPEIISFWSYVLRQKRGFNVVFKVIEGINKSGTKGITPFKNVAKGAGYASMIVAVIDALVCWKRGEFSAGVGELYGGFISARVPIAGAIDGVQTLLAALSPGLDKNPKVQMVLKATKHINPVAAGKIGIDAVVTWNIMMLKSVTSGKMNIADFEKLEKRMQKSPLEVYTLLGTKIGDFVGDATGSFFYEYVLKNTDFFD